MNLDPAPRHSKLVFLAIDAGLLLTAFIVVYFAKNPYAPLPFVSALLCVVVAAIVGLIPFLTDYAADSAEYVQAEQSRVAEQAQRLHAATETLTRAAAQIKAVEEAVHKTAHAAENLPYRMQEKLAEFNETLATKDTEEREALERELDELRAANSDQLKAVADKLSKGIAHLLRKYEVKHEQATGQIVGPHRVKFTTKDGQSKEVTADHIVIATGENLAFDGERRRGAEIKTSDETLAGLMTRHRVTHLQCTPSMAQMLVADQDARSALAGLRRMMVGGEAFPPALARELRGLVGGVVMNMYGPTETTIWSTVQELDGTDVGVPLGRPLANQQVYILDSRQQPLPPGIPGELVIGGGTDQYVSYSQTGGLHILEHTLDAICEMFPMFTRMKMLRSWGGIVDVTPDRSPILAKTPVKGLYVNCGWGTGGFKATPGSGNVFAHTIAKDEPHPINAPFTLERFRTGRLIDEAAAAAVAH